MPADQLTTSRAELDNEPIWDQVNVEFTDWATAADVVAHDLRPVLNQMAGGWWYIRKHPHWRLRHRADGDANRQPAAQLRAALDDLTRNGVLRTWYPAIYEPEILAFGGPAGMHAAHDLFRRDSCTTLDLLASTATPAAAEGRTELSLLAISRMLRAAGIDWYEQGDVWAKVADSRRGPDTARAVAADVPAAVRRLVTLDTGPDTALVTNGPLRAHRAWLDAFDSAGTQLGVLARTGYLTRGLRAVLAHHIIFHWNRFALPGGDQHTLATLARDALLPSDLPSGLQSGKDPR
jgi:protein-L-isoaspartate(D-aspartate) O-methyltransferase